MVINWTDLTVSVWVSKYICVCVYLCASPFFRINLQFQHIFVTFSLFMALIFFLLLLLILLFYSTYVFPYKFSLLLLCNAKYDVCLGGKVVKWKARRIFYVDLIQEFNLKWEKENFPRWKCFSLKFSFEKVVCLVNELGIPLQYLWPFLFLCRAHWFFDTRKQFLEHASYVAEVCNHKKYVML